MLFGYPIAATAQNWLHESLCEALTNVNEILEKGQALPSWPNILPSSNRARLKSRTGLRDRIDSYAIAAKSLSRAERARILRCITEQNAIADLVGARSNCECLTDLPIAIQAPTRELFDFAFILLTSLGMRDIHYSAIYNAIKYHVCPFCGCEYFDAPGSKREDLDHYLAASRYPFAAANLRNLSPMGVKCNARYKHAKDILRDSLGNRRRSFDPYGASEVRISLLNSTPFGQSDGRTPVWKVDFIPDTEECVTWNEVFDLKGRLIRDVLNPSFPRWLAEFGTWFVKRKNVTTATNRQITLSVKEYAENSAITGLTSQEFLRAPVFWMVEKHCRDGNQRLLNLIRDIVKTPR
jgi:hypothetical protein